VSDLSLSHIYNNFIRLFDVIEFRGDNMSEKMEKAEKNCCYVCDVCGCEVVCTTPSSGPLVCCEQVMCCC